MFQKTLELDPLSPVANVNLAASLRGQGRAQEAAERARRAIEIEPGLASAYGFIANLYAEELSQPDEAIRLQRKAIEVDPENLSQRVELADLPAWVGREEEAPAECRAIVAGHPEFAPAFAQILLSASHEDDIRRTL
jgi:tetratricopeptide (TPR) repeat protein